MGRGDRFLVPVCCQCFLSNRRNNKRLILLFRILKIRIEPDFRRIELNFRRIESPERRIEPRFRRIEPQKRRIDPKTNKKKRANRTCPRSGLGQFPIKHSGKSLYFQKDSLRFKRTFDKKRQFPKRGLSFAANTPIKETRPRSSGGFCGKNGAGGLPKRRLCLIMDRQHFFLWECKNWTKKMWRIYGNSLNRIIRN